MAVFTVPLLLWTVMKYTGKMPKLTEVKKRVKERGKELSNIFRHIQRENVSEESAETFQ